MDARKAPAGIIRPGLVQVESQLSLLLRIEAVDGPNPFAAVELAEFLPLAGPAIQPNGAGMLVVVPKHDRENDDCEGDRTGKVSYLRASCRSTRKSSGTPSAAARPCRTSTLPSRFRFSIWLR